MNKKCTVMTHLLVTGFLCVSPLLLDVSAAQNTAPVFGALPLTSSPDAMVTKYNLSAPNLADPAGNRDDRDISLHKILGISTLGMVAVTFATGAVIPKTGHCALSGVATALATVTCIHGYYEYGSMINFTDGEWQYNIHAVAATAATAGFLASCILAGEDGDKSHVAVGAASGIAYAVSMVTLYF